MRRELVLLRLRQNVVERTEGERDRQRKGTEGSKSPKIKSRAFKQSGPHETSHSQKSTGGADCCCCCMYCM